MFLVNKHTPIVSVFWHVTLRLTVLPDVLKKSVFFLLNNQLDALSIQIFFCYKTLHVSRILSAHHQEFSTVHPALVSFMQVFDDRFQAVTMEPHFHPDSAWSVRQNTARNIPVPSVQ
jgi:hypothetical protein